MRVQVRELTVNLRPFQDQVRDVGALVNGSLDMRLKRLSTAVTLHRNQSLAQSRRRRSRKGSRARPTKRDRGEGSQNSRAAGGGDGGRGSIDSGVGWGGSIGGGGVSFDSGASGGWDPAWDTTCKNLVTRFAMISVDDVRAALIKTGGHGGRASTLCKKKEAGLVLAEGMGGGEGEVSQPSPSSSATAATTAPTPTPTQTPTPVSTPAQVQAQHVLESVVLVALPPPSSSLAHHYLAHP
jgi:hypothetical protein